MAKSVVHEVETVVIRSCLNNLKDAVKKEICAYNKYNKDLEMRHFLQATWSELKEIENLILSEIKN